MANQNKEVYHSDDWEIVVSARWKLKKGITPHLTCIRCKGKGGWEVSTLFNCDEDPETYRPCPDCYQGKIVNHEIGDRPSIIPNDYKDCIRVAHYGFLDNRKNRRHLNDNIKV